MATNSKLTALQMVEQMARVAAVLDGLGVDVREISNGRYSRLSVQVNGADLDIAADRFGLGEPHWYLDNVERVGEWGGLGRLIEFYSAAADYPREKPVDDEAVAS